MNNNKDYKQFKDMNLIELIEARDKHTKLLNMINYYIKKYEEKK